MCWWFRGANNFNANARNIDDLGAGRSDIGPYVGNSADCADWRAQDSVQDVTSPTVRRAVEACHAAGITPMHIVHRKVVPLVLLED
jgi:hypothetical protein